MPETLASYTGGRYVQINMTLRGLAAGRTKAARIAAYNTMLNDIAAMERELVARARIAAGTILYRRAGPVAQITNLMGAAYRTGEDFRDQAFLSTSTRVAYRTPQGGGQLVMQITCSANSRAHDVGDVRGNNNEAEVLFERGTRFLIKSVRQIGNDNVLWEMTELTGT